MAEFWDGYLFPTIIIVGQILLVVVPLLGAVAYLTYAERKVIGAMQMRKGPNVVGPFRSATAFRRCRQTVLQGNHSALGRQPPGLRHGADADLHPGA